MFILEGKKDNEDPTKEDIAKELSNLQNHEVEFISLKKEGQGFIQAAIPGEGSFYVEVHLDNNKSYRSKNSIDYGRTLDLFYDFFEGKNDFQTESVLEEFDIYKRDVGHPVKNKKALISAIVVILGLIIFGALSSIVPWYIAFIVYILIIRFYLR
jgi:hypothetical protein